MGAVRYETYVKTCKKWCGKKKSKKRCESHGWFLLSQSSQPRSWSWNHPFPYKSRWCSTVSPRPKQQASFFLHAAVDLFPPQIQICMEHAGTHFVESVCSDLMTASCCNSVADFNKAWQWKNLRQSWWLLTSLLSSRIIKSYNSRSWLLWTFAMNKYRS